MSFNIIYFTQTQSSVLSTSSVSSSATSDCSLPDIPQDEVEWMSNSSRTSSTALLNSSTSTTNWKTKFKDALKIGKKRTKILS